MTLWRRLFGRGELDRELDAELRDHLERQVADFTKAGLSQTEARRKAAAKFGGLEQAKEYCRDQRGTRWLEDLGTDLRYGVRMLAHSRTFTVVAVLSLALGIGANTAIFSLVNSVLLRSLPVHEPDRLVMLKDGSWTNPIWEEIRNRQPTLFGAAAAWSEETFDLAAGGQAEPANGLLVSGAFFETLGVVPALGQPIVRANDGRDAGGAQTVAVISHSFWLRRFGGAPDVLGRTLSVNRVPFTIVGVTPPQFLGPNIGRSYDVAVPLAAADLLSNEPSRSRLDGRSYWWLEIVVRLKPGETAEGATGALRAVQPQIREATLPTGWPPHHLERYLRDGLTLEPASQGPGELRTQYERPLMIIMVVVALVLLIACANIANLMLARANARRHELTMRLALGASGGRLARQLLTESLLLAGLGALVGLAFAQWGSRALVSQLSTSTTTVALDLAPDWRVLAFTTALTVVTALLFGLVPAIRARHLAPIEALKEQGRGLSAGRRFLGSPLVVVQIALSLVLVVGAGLFMRTFATLGSLDLGFDRDPVLLVHVNVQRSTVPLEQRGALLIRLRDAAAAVPGVAHAAVSPITPVSGMGWNDAFEFPDQPGLAERDRLVFLNAATPGWFVTYGTELRGGRDFTADDRVGAPPVAIANEAFVRKFMRGANPVGRMVQPASRPGQQRPAYQIVGLVENIAYRSVRDPAPPTLFVPLAQLEADEVWPSASISVRAAAGSPALLTRSLVAALGAVDRDVSLRFQPLADQVNGRLTRERLLAMLSGFFGALALLLAGVGLYGVTSYAVSLRRTEIGVRMALGADAHRVLRLVLGRVVVLLALGLVIGTGISVWASRFVGELLFGLEPRDPTTLVVAVLVMAAASALAALLPAWRAARIDPVEVLREG